MKKLLILVMAIGLIGFSPASFSHRGAEDAEILIVDLSKKLPTNPYEDEYQKLLYPTVRIKTLFSTGSGVAIDNYILTAAHVVGEQSEVKVEIFNHRDTESTEIEATVIITDTAKDLALLKPSRPLSYTATLAPESYTPYIFTPVFTVGCSLGLTPRPSNGIISVITDSYWEITSPILPGNSGGPVYNANTYELIGIAVWIHTYQGQIITTMAGIVPVSQIYEFLENSHRATECTENK